MVVHESVGSSSVQKEPAATHSKHAGSRCAFWNRLGRLAPAAHRALTLHSNNTSGDCSHTGNRHTAHTRPATPVPNNSSCTLLHTQQQSCRQLKDVGPVSRKQFRLSCDTLQRSYQSCCCCNGAVTPLLVNTTAPHHVRRRQIVCVIYGQHAAAACAGRLLTGCSCRCCLLLAAAAAVAVRQAGPCGTRAARSATRR